MGKEGEKKGRGSGGRCKTCERKCVEERKDAKQRKTVEDEVELDPPLRTVLDLLAAGLIDGGGGGGGWRSGGREGGLEGRARRGKQDRREEEGCCRFGWLLGAPLGVTLITMLRIGTRDTILRPLLLLPKEKKMKKKEKFTPSTKIFSPCPLSSSSSSFSSWP